MYKILTVNGLDINSDISGVELPPGTFTDGVNFRVKDDTLETTEGNSLWYTCPCSVSTGRSISANDGSKDYIISASSTGIFITDGTQSGPIYNTGFSEIDPFDWSFDKLGPIVVANHPIVGALYSYPIGIGSNFYFLPYSNLESFDPVYGRTAKVIRSHKTFLFLLNLTERVNNVSVEQIDGYRWSHPADVNSIPPSWDETDQFFLAGKANLGTQGGAIVDGLSLIDSFIIYSENSIDSLTLTGDSFVWRRNTLTTNVGLLAKDCVVEVNGNHFLITPDDIIVNNGNEVKSILFGKLRKHFRERLSSTYYKKSFAIHNKSDKEVWFCIPTGTSTDVDLAYVYNYYLDRWSIRDLPNNTRHLVSSSKTSNSNSWDSVQGQTWSQFQNATWGSMKQITPFDDTLFSVISDGQILDIKDTLQPNNGTILERLNFPLEGLKQVTSLVRVYPKVKSSSPVIFRFGFQQHYGGPITWKPEVEYNPSTQRKIDIRTTGESHCWQIKNKNGEYFKFSGMDIEYTLSGAR